MILTLLNWMLSLTPVLVPFLALGYIAVRHQRVFLTVFMLLAAFESTRDFAPSLGMTFSGISVYPEDLITVVGAGAALNRIGQWRFRSVTRAAILVFATIVGLGVISWILTYGIQMGFNSWRGQMLIVALLAYTSTRPRAWSWNDLRGVIVASAIVVALASLVSILLYGFGSSSSVVEVRGAMEGGRPISGSGSLMILIGLWVIVFSAGKWSANRVLLVLFLGSTVLLAQNRSVWVAAIFGVVVWWLAPRIRSHGASSGGRDSFTRTLVIFFVAMATALVGSFVTSLGQSARDSVTWQWRVSRWTDSMSIPRSWLEWLVGSSFGPTPASTPTLFSTSAHSLYVDSTEMLGFVGLVTILYLLIAIGRAHVPPSIEPLGLVVSFTFLSFGVAYQLPPWAWMFTGILLASTGIEQPGGSGHKTRSTVRDLTGTATSEEHVVNQATL